MRLILITVLGVIFLFSCKKDSITPPVPPASLTATATSTSQINLSWTDNSTNESGFKVERKTGNSNYAEITSVNKDVTSYSDINLIKNTTYTYRVYAYNDGGKSLTYTNEATAKTLDDVPATATNLTAVTIAYNQINLTWEDKATNETGYKVERMVVNGSFSVIVTIGANTASYSDNNLTENTIYAYRVFPYNTSGNGAYSNEASDTTLLDITSGLVAYYPFSGNAGDSSGNGKHGTVLSAVLTTDRFLKSNSAYYIDGVNCPSPKGINGPVSINNANEYSISFWFKTTDSLKSNQSYFNSSPHQFIGAAYNYIDRGAVSSLGIGNGTWVNAGPSGNIIWSTPVGTSWNNITIVKKIDKFLSYQNGILLSTVPINSSFNTGTINNFIMGASSINGGVNCYETFKGNIDDFRFYNRALTQEQITYLATH